MPNMNHQPQQSHQMQQVHQSHQQPNHLPPPHHHMHHQSSSTQHRQQQQQQNHHSNHGPGSFDRVNGRSDLVEIKSKLDAEFRRFAQARGAVRSFGSFYELLESFHQLKEIPFMIFYTDPTHGDLLPINNDENLAKAISLAKPLLRLFLQRKGEGWEQLTVGRGAKKSAFFGGISNLLPITSTSPTKPKLSIGMPEDFRQVSQIIDVGPLPETCRRVRLIKHGSDRPLGFYIRDGTSVRVTPQGLEKVPGIFISRLLPGGLAEGTGLLAVNDEVLEVNGIEVLGKTLDQVTDMMVANSSNLIIKIRPATQRSLPLPVSGFNGPNSPPDSASPGSGHSHSDQSEDEEDEIKDHLAGATSNPAAAPVTKTMSHSKSANGKINISPHQHPSQQQHTSSAYQQGRHQSSPRLHHHQQQQQQQPQHKTSRNATSGSFSNPNFQYSSTDESSNNQTNRPSNSRNGKTYSTNQSTSSSNAILKEPPIVSNLEDDLEDDVVTL